MSDKKYTLKLTKSQLETIKVCLVSQRSHAQAAAARFYNNPDVRESLCKEQNKISSVFSEINHVLYHKNTK